MKVLESLHQRVARYCSLMFIRKLEDGLEHNGLYKIQEYIQRRRDRINRYIRNRPIYTRCIGSHSLVGGAKRFWWNQNKIVKN